MLLLGPSFDRVCAELLFSVVPWPLSKHALYVSEVRPHIGVYNALHGLITVLHAYALVRHIPKQLVPCWRSVAGSCYYSTVNVKINTLIMKILNYNPS